MTSVEQNAATVGDVLRRAAEVMSERGQCKGNLNDAEGRVCMWGAVEVALQELDIRTYYLGLPSEMMLRNGSPVVGAIGDAIRAANLDNRCPFPGADWNDDDDRTQTEVEKFLLACADRADFPGGA